MDPAAIAVGRQLENDDKRFRIHHAPFSTMAEVIGPGRPPRRDRSRLLRTLATLLRSPRAPLFCFTLRCIARARTENRTLPNTRAQVLDEESVSGILFDLGISSPQFDEAGRGFRPEQDGPLDLRFDQSKGESAFELLQRIPREELARILTVYGDGQDRAAAQRIADAVCLQREAEGGLPSRTREFAALVASVKGREYQAMHPAKLTFQASGRRIFWLEIIFFPVISSSSWGDIATPEGAEESNS